MSPNPLIAIQLNKNTPILTALIIVFEPTLYSLLGPPENRRRTQATAEDRRRDSRRPQETTDVKLAARIKVNVGLYSDICSLIDS